MLNFETTQNFINSRVTTSTSPVNQIIETYGYYSLGGLGAAKWRSTGNVITPSQDPLALNDIKLSDASGNEYELVVNSAGVIDLNVLGGTSAGYVSIAEAAGLVYSQNLGSGGGVGNIVKETIIATDFQTLFNTIGNYNLGGSNLNVYINGVRQDAASYSETSISSFTLNEPSSAGDEVEYIINEVPSITSEGISVIDTVNTLSNLNGVLIGQVFMVEERANALFQAKTGLSPNGYDIIAGQGAISFQISLPTNTISCAQYGLNGDGVTDNLTALTSLLASSYDVEVDRGKIYLTSGTVTVSTSKKIFGGGEIKGSLTTGNLIEATANDVIFEDISIDGGAQPITGIKFTGVEDGAIINCRFKQCYESGIVGNGSTLRARIIGNFLDDCKETGAAQQNGSIRWRGDNAVINDNVIVDGDTTGISCTGDYCTIAGNSIKAGSAPESGGIITDGAVGCSITGNSIEGSGVEGIQIGGASLDCSVVGNTIKNAEEGGIVVSGTSLRTTVSGNTIVAANATSTYPYGILIESTSQISVTGNTVKFHERGIRLLNNTAAPEHISISGNTLISQSNTAIYGYGNCLSITGNICKGSGAGTSATGILIDTAIDSDNLIVSSNIVDGWTTGLSGIFTGGTQFRVRDNIFLNNTADTSQTDETADIFSGNSTNSGALSGEVTLNGTSSVTVNTTALLANDKILLYRKTPSGTEGAAFISARVNGTSFNVKSTNAADTSVMTWILDR